MMDVIVTVSPYAPWIGEVAAHPIVSGLRFNTVMPVSGSKTAVLRRLAKAAAGKPVWVDLKTRQVRTVYAQYYDPPKGYPAVVRGKHGKARLETSDPVVHGDVRCAPWSAIKVTHKLSVDLSGGPIPCYFNDGLQKALLVDVVGGDQLVFLDGPKKRIGPGESINIMHPSLKIDGFLNAPDREYLEACRESGVKNLMLSYVEADSDIEEVLGVLPDARIRAKVESERGCDEWVTGGFKERWLRHPQVNLVAATGDLYVEVGATRPEKVIRPIRRIVNADPDAWFASRLLSSLRDGPRPAMPDLLMVAWLWEIGYRHLMIGEEIFMEKDTVLLALDMLAAAFDELRLGV
jgi:pyruvate kinase